MPLVLLFAVRSPIAVEYEESCHRCGIEIEQSVSLGAAPRVLDLSKVVEIADFDPAASCGKFYACAFASRTRKAFSDRAEALGLQPAEGLVDPTAVLAGSVRVGDGTFINAGAIIGAASIIGEGVLINRAASVGHHALIGDFASIGPGVTLAGNIHVGSGSIIGAGATVLPDIRIGENCLVAGGSLVRADVPDNTFVAGVPAKPRPFDPVKSTLYIQGGE